MKGKARIAMAAGAGAVALAAGGLLLWPSVPEADGRALYLDNCASCHGAALEGQPDWRHPGPSGRLPAPPHDASGHTWHHPDRVLREIVRRGSAAVVGQGYESDMPGFEGILTDSEIDAILDYIKSTWPARERSFQSRVTEADGG